MDHLRSRTQIKMEEEQRRRPFKFTNVIGKRSDFHQLIRENWEETASLFHSTLAMFRLTKKLKALKQSLRILIKRKLGDMPGRMKEAFDILCIKQKETMENSTVEAIKEKTKGMKEMAAFSRVGGKVLQTNIKLYWLKVGDQNTKAFHNAVNLREVRNAIHELKGHDGLLLLEMIKKWKLRGILRIFFHIYRRSMRVYQWKY